MGGMNGKIAVPEDTGCYNFASIIEILESQGMILEKKPIIFSNVVEVADGFHFYYNAEKVDKLEIAEIFDVSGSTNSES